jgi:hypothetical protein
VYALFTNEIASNKNKLVMQKSMYIAGRYELKSKDPVYKSATCEIYIAVDHDSQGDLVALKMMVSAGRMKSGYLVSAPKELSLHMDNGTIRLTD